MSVGLDFGTATCSVSHVVENKVRSIALNEGEIFIPSTLCAPSREAITEYLYRHLNISPMSEVGDKLLRGSINKNKTEGLDLIPDDIRFGRQATALYLEDPTDYYYVKSPKSFLGILGLDDIRYTIFEDIVCAMMANIKQNIEASLNKQVDETVIGRPINFHSKGGEESNIQAENILRRAASRAGFKHIEFQFEPVAAGLEYEANLTSDKNVLVVDIGGGTSDCSLIRMGPSWVGKQQRSESLLGHAGSFVGGNDLDINLASQSFMFEFGKDTNSKSGLPMPNMPFWECIAINDVVAQKTFYSRSNLRTLKAMQSSATQPDKLARLIEVYQNTLGHSIVAEAERVKIALSDCGNYTATIQLPSDSLSIPVSLQQMEKSIYWPVRKIQKLVKETLAQAATQPDEIFITGGSARSPIVRETIKSVVGDVPIANGDYVGSVTSGLARWADLCFG
ncbi:molecular chaperone [Paraglaciecola aquimarina]|uniref:Molecular chaperone n=1 Tax=Paraglaciecola aquimarina TaxID=1235557 RepID=A0ABU3SRM0_9ALTE|nr:molecular chaperone [Paraglaciecola aquimarina]MDU0352663.1 molecular chaperone [Paraglaciecola aquimarina]